MQPLAIVTIGGLVYATFLTLLVVPLCMHCLTGTAGKNRGGGGVDGMDKIITKKKNI